MRSRLICPALLWMLTGAIAAAPSLAAEVDIRARPTVTVTGHGETSAAPDVARISLGVETQAAEASAALDANNKAMQQLISTLTQQGVAEKNIQTSSFDISPVYRHDDPQRNGAPQVSGYRVSNQVQVKVTNLDSLGKLLDQVVRVGANRIHGIQFDVENADELTDKAREKAIENARRKAELLASAAGAKVGRPLQIQESSGGGQPPQPMFRMAMAAESVPVAQGEQQLAADITVTYELVTEGADEQQ